MGVNIRYRQVGYGVECVASHVSYYGERNSVVYCIHYPLQNSAAERCYRDFGEVLCYRVKVDLANVYHAVDNASAENRDVEREDNRNAR